jgi:hypothetical protein
MNIGLVAPLNVSHCCLTRENLVSFLSKKMIALFVHILTMKILGA